MKSFSIKEALIPALSLGLICLIVTVLLTVTNIVTNPVIDKMEKDKVTITRKTVLPEAFEFKEINNTEDTFEGLNEQGNIIGYVFTTSVKGYGGEILVMTGISIDNQVKGVALLSQNETPGLGANATKEDFRDQFKGNVPDNGFSVVKQKPNAGEIKAMTGATISSKAVSDAVNIAVDKFHNIQNGGVNDK